MISWKKPVNIENVSAVEAVSGIHMKTLMYNDDATLCHFTLEKGSKIPLHNHVHTQIGFVLEGNVKFITEEGEFLVKPGDSYVFNAWQKHGAEVIETAKIIEVFSPGRPEYIPKETQYKPNFQEFKK